MISAKRIDVNQHQSPARGTTDLEILVESIVILLQSHSRTFFANDGELSFFVRFESGFESPFGVLFDLGGLGPDGGLVCSIVDELESVEGCSTA